MYTSGSLPRWSKQGSLGTFSWGKPTQPSSGCPTKLPKVGWGTWLPWPSSGSRPSDLGCSGSAPSLLDCASTHVQTIQTADFIISNNVQWNIEITIWPPKIRRPRPAVGHHEPYNQVRWAEWKSGTKVDGVKKGDHPLALTTGSSGSLGSSGNPPYHHHVSRAL